jgi:membrane protease YdiL (CAAX protease family)
MLLKLFSKANQRFGIIFTAFLFGLAHGNVAQFSLGFIVGIFLGHITQKHNSIIPAIICHIAVNVKSEILSHVYDTEYGYIIATAITMSASIFGLIMLFDFRLKNKLPATTPHQTRRGFTLAVFSIPLMLTVVYQIYNALTFII